MERQRRVQSEQDSKRQAVTIASPKSKSTLAWKDSNSVESRSPPILLRMMIKKAKGMKHSKRATQNSRPMHPTGQQPTRK
jgi:hypothetical protein